MSLQYYRYPFARNSSQPKIPDGKIESSIGMCRKQIVQTTINAQPTTPVIYVIHLPHFNNVCTVYQFDNVGVPNPDDPLLPNITNWAETQSAYTTDRGAMLDGNGLYITSLDVPSIWRLVSSGMKIVPTTASTNLNGFYETITIPVDYTDVNWEKDAVNVPLIAGLSHLKYKISRTTIADLERNKLTWRNHQSYHTGNLSDLGQLAFNLPVNNPDHTPTSILSSYEIDNEFVHKAFVDENFLMRVVRIEGTAAQNFNFVMQTNYEFVFSFKSIIRAFQTENYAQVDMNRVLQDIRQIENANGTQSVDDETFTFSTHSSGPPPPPRPTGVRDRAIQPLQPFVTPKASARRNREEKDDDMSDGNWTFSSRQKKPKAINFNY